MNVKEQGRLLRQSEFLVWEGRGGKKSLRQVFLFEDLVLFSKARRFPDRKVSFCFSAFESELADVLLTLCFLFPIRPNRIWIFTFTRTVLRPRILAWPPTSVISPLNLRFGSGNASPAIHGHCRVCRKMWRMPGPMRFPNCCGSKPSGTEVSDYCDWFRCQELFFIWKFLLYRNSFSWNVFNGHRE